MKRIRTGKVSRSFKANACISSLSNFMVSWIFLNSTNKLNHSSIFNDIYFKKVKCIRTIYLKLIKNLVFLPKVKHYVLKFYDTKKIFNPKKLKKVISKLFVFKNESSSIFYYLYLKVVLQYKIFSGWKNSLSINNSNISNNIFMILKNKILSHSFIVNFHGLQRLTSIEHHILQSVFFMGLIKKNSKHILLAFFNYFTNNLVFNSQYQYVTIDFFNASKKGCLP